jgi:hypothetical protein
MSCPYEVGFRFISINENVNSLEERSSLGLHAKREVARFSLLFTGAKECTYKNK